MMLWECRLSTVVTVKLSIAIDDMVADVVCGLDFASVGLCAMAEDVELHFRGLLINPPQLCAWRGEAASIHQIAVGVMDVVVQVDWWTDRCSAAYIALHAEHPIGGNAIWGATSLEASTLPSTLASQFSAKSIYQ